MAYNAVSTTKNAIAAMRYGEHEKSVIRGGVDCPPDTENACRLFAADRIMWNKDNGIQAHILIQSFDGRECSPEEANKIGQELAQRTCPGHRAMVYTHQESEGGNIHNPEALREATDTVMDDLGGDLEALKTEVQQTVWALQGAREKKEKSETLEMFKFFGIAFAVIVAAFYVALLLYGWWYDIPEAVKGVTNHNTMLEAINNGIYQLLNR